MEMQISFPGGRRVDAEFEGFRVATDQPAPLGQGTAPAPFDYFLTSIGTCAGYFVLEFLRQREIPTDGLRLELSTTREPGSHMLSRITLRVHLPQGFPAKYERAIRNAVDLCSVKKHLLAPPEIRTELIAAAPVHAG